MLKMAKAPHERLSPQQEGWDGRCNAKSKKNLSPQENKKEVNIK